MGRNFGIKERAVVLALNLATAYVVFVATNGRWSLTTGIETTWLICAASLWFLSLLSAPWFVPPRDALVSALGAFLLLATMSISANVNFANELSALRAWSIGFCVIVIFLAIVALFLHDKDQRSPVGRFAFKIVGVFGRGELLFSAPAVLSIVAAYQSSLPTTSWLLLFWILVTVGRPVELVAAAWRQLTEDRSALKGAATVGTISRIDYPNIIRVRLRSVGAWQPNRLFAAGMPDGSEQYVLSLFAQVQGVEVVGTGICVASAQEARGLPNGSVCESHDEALTAEFLENLSGAQGARLVGFVVENSNIGIVSFEVASISGLKEGDVVFARLSGLDVFYQIVGAETVEEKFNENPRGTHVVSAAQLGIYSPDEGFTKYAWLPPMNTPLFSAAERQFDPPVISDREFEIGKVPSTNVGAVANLDDLIEYHTAILGVTGTGKTEVALDAVRHAANNGVKVFCVDFTGDYKARLAELDPIFPNPDTTKASNLEKLLAFVDAYGFKAGDEKKKMGSLLKELRDETATAIADFLTSDDHSIAIFELPEISNSKAGLRLTEIYLSAIMNWAKEHRRARQVLICLEEAHTIVPEPYGSGFDGETKWVVERIGQIALQGRKYGVGLLVISQRTALVSKTILSQCNTFLTHTLIDQTSLNFLESVYSSQHTRLVPNLGKFEFLAFGKAIKAERPIILRREFDQALLDASLALRVELPANAVPQTGASDAAEEAVPEPEDTAAPASENPFD